MLKRDKNALLGYIEDRKLDVSRFTLRETSHDTGLRTDVALAGTPLFFGIYHSHDSYELASWTCSEFKPRFPRYVSSGLFPIQYVFDAFKRWLDGSVKPFLLEEATPDLWALASATSLAVPAELSTDDTAAFSASEIAALKMALRAFETGVRDAFVLSEEQRTLVAERLLYLELALTRLSKTDWKGVAISTLVTVATALSLNTDQGRQLFDLFRRNIAQVLRLLQ